MKHTTAGMATKLSRKFRNKQRLYVAIYYEGTTDQFLDWKLTWALLLGKKNDDHSADHVVKYRLDYADKTLHVSPAMRASRQQFQLARVLVAKINKGADVDNIVRNTGTSEFAHSITGGMEWVMEALLRLYVKNAFATAEIDWHRVKYEVEKFAIGQLYAHPDWSETPTRGLVAGGMGPVPTLDITKNPAKEITEKEKKEKK